MEWLTLARLGVILSVPALVVACVVDSTEHSPPRGVVATGGGGANGGGGTTGGVVGTTSPSPHPILANVDTNQTMTAAPGQGVGVFTEYTAGGHWHVWWTCDTGVNPQNASCAFDVTIAVQSGAIQNVITEQFEPNDTLTQATGGQQLEAVTTTSTGLDSVTFDTAPGATITLTATIGGAYAGSFLFFVEGGKVNDGVTGGITDPLMLQPSAP